MNGKRECKIVQDLLPSYIEKLTSNETNQYIENHINNCTECQQMLENMKEEIDGTNKIDKRQINYLKKYNRKLKILSTIILLIILIFAVITGNKILILTKIADRAENNLKSDNYHIKVSQYEEHGILIAETYKKEEKQITYLTHYDNENPEQNYQYIYYIEGENETDYMKGNNGEIQKVGTSIAKDDSFSHYAVNVTKAICNYNENLWSLLRNSIMSSVRTVKCNGRECYYFSNLDNSAMIKDERKGEIYFDKEVGLPIRAICGTMYSNQGAYDGIIDFEYEFNNTSDNDVKAPEIVQN